MQILPKVDIVLSRKGSQILVRLFRGDGIPRKLAEATVNHFDEVPSAINALQKEVSSDD